MFRKSTSILLYALMLLLVYAVPEASAKSRRDIVVEYAWKIYNFEWTATQPILLHNMGGTKVPAGRIRGIPYTLYGTGYTFKEFQKLIASSEAGENTDLYKIVTYDIWTGAKRTSMKCGMACAMFVTDCILQGLLPNDKFTKTEQEPKHQPAIEFHDETGWIDCVTEHAKNYDGYAGLRPGDYVDNFSSHVRLVIANDVSAQKITYLDQTPFELGTSSNMVGTHWGESNYSSLASDSYTPMYVEYPDDTPDGLEITSSLIPDDLFREYCRLRYDTDNNGYFSDTEIAYATDMGWYAGPHPDNNVPNPAYSVRSEILDNNGERWRGIKSIEGVKIFKYLQWLYVYDDSLEGTVDVSGMEHLTDFRCNGNKITSINASSCPALKHLECHGNNISSLNITGSKALEYFDAHDNNLTALDFSEFTSLTYLGISNNYYFTSLKLKNCSSLQEIQASSTGFETLSISDMPFIKTLNVQMSTSLKELYCYNNALTELNVKTCRSLERLECQNNQLASLSVFGCRVLAYVDCTNNKLSSITNLGSCQNTLNVLRRDSDVKLLPDSIAAPEISTSSMNNAVVGETYYSKISASGTGIIRYALNVNATAIGFLADGSVLECTTGVINGTPKTAKDSYTIRVTAENFVGETYKDYTIKITNNGKGPKIDTTTLADGIKGKSYSQTITANSAYGSLPMTWERISGTLPDGLELTYSGRNAYIKGTPQKAGTFTFKLEARSTSNSTHDRKDFSIKIDEITPPKITTNDLSDKRATAGSVYSKTLVAESLEAVTWSIVDGILPEGLTLNTSTGEISGTPKSLEEVRTGAGTKEYVFTVRASNSAGNTDKQFTLTVYEPFEILTTSLASGIVGQEYSAEINAVGGRWLNSAIDSFYWKVKNGTLPDADNVDSCERIAS